MSQLEQFQRMHRELFQQPAYDWRLAPHAGYYYPYQNYNQPKPYVAAQQSGQKPYYFNDKYYEYYQLKPKGPAKKPPKIKGKKYQSPEIRFEKLGEVYFKNGQSKLDPAARNELSKIAQRLMKRNFSYLNIRGYTDVKGSAAKNQRLGLARARRTAEFLEDLGVNMQNTYIGSAGESTEKAKLSKNRRAEVLGFYNPLPGPLLNIEADRNKYDRSSPNFFFLFIVVLFFIGIVGVAVYVITVN